MTNMLAIAIAQLNPIVGDVAGNRDKVVAAWEFILIGALILFCIPNWCCRAIRRKTW